MLAELGVVRKTNSCTRIEKDKALQCMWKTESEESRLHAGRVGLELYISLHSPCRNGRSCRLRAFSRNKTYEGDLHVCELALSDLPKTAPATSYAVFLLKHLK